jgi:hypothetical protein
MTLEHGLIGPDFPSIETRQLGKGFQIGVFRPIRVDHTDFFKWLLKLIHSSIRRIIIIVSVIFSNLVRGRLIK